MNKINDDDVSHRAIKKLCNTFYTTSSYSLLLQVQEVEVAQPVAQRPRAMLRAYHQSHKVTRSRSTVIRNDTLEKSLLLLVFRCNYICISYPF